MSVPTGVYPYYQTDLRMSDIDGEHVKNASIYHRDTIHISDATGLKHAIASGIDELLSDPTISQPVLLPPSNHNLSKILNKEYAVALVNDIPEQLDLSDASFQRRVAFYQKRFDTDQRQILELTEKYESSSKKFNSLVAAFSKNCKALNKALQDNDKQKDAVSNLYAECKSLTHGTADFQVLNIKIQQLQSTLSQSEGDIFRISDEVSKVLQEVEQAAGESYYCYNDIIDKCSAPVSSDFLQSDVHKKHLNSLGTFIALIISFIKQINDSNIESLKGQSQLTKLINETRLHEYENKVKEAENKNATSRTINKFLSIFGAVAGAVLAVATLVAAIPSGGVSLGGTVLLITAVVGLTASIVDTVLTFTIDFSPIGYVFGKIIEGLSWLYEHTLTELVVTIAKASGASDSTVNDINKYFSMACAFVTILVLSVVVMTVGGGSSGKAAAQVAQTATKESARTAAKSAATEVAQSVANSAAESVGKDVVQAATKESIQKTTKAATDAASKTTVSNITEAVTKATSSISKLSSLASKASVVSSVLNAIVPPALTIASSIYSKEYYDLQAEMKLNKQDMEILQQLRKTLTSQLQSVSQSSAKLNKSICDVMRDRTQTLSQGYHNIQRLGAM